VQQPVGHLRPGGEGEVIGAGEVGEQRISPTSNAFASSAGAAGIRASVSPSPRAAGD
jgi:hypothetical protein